MIPMMNITAWRNVVPWAEQRQVEQDLIISRALVALFSNPGLRRQLRFRGGTAPNKLHFTEPLRYSEDIDLGPEAGPNDVYSANAGGRTLCQPRHGRRL